MMLDRFNLTAHGTTVGTEIRAGLATFLTMSYILLVNPQVLAPAGLPPDDVAIATALASAAATLVMGLWAGYPFALAPGMGLNAYFTYGVVLGLGVDYRIALAAVFVEGLLFLSLAVGGIRAALIRAIPSQLKIATMSGIGLFLSIIGLQNGGIVVDHPQTLVTLGDVRSASALLALSGIVLIGALLVRRVPGAILLGIAAMTVTAWLTGVAPPPDRFFSWPGLPRETLGALDFSLWNTGTFAVVVLSLLFVHFFDTSVALLSLGRLSGRLNADETLPRAERAFTSDVVGSTLGGLLGTSTVTTYIESATGIEEGGRTGLTAVVVAVCFLAALFFIPIFAAVPPAATAPALVVVGALMMEAARDIEWRQLENGLPAFLVIAGMAFTYSIAHGIALGLITYTLLRVAAGRFRDVPPLLYLLTALLLLYYAFLGGH